MLEIDNDKSQKVKYKKSIKYAEGVEVYSLGNSFNQGLTVSKGIIAKKSVAIEDKKTTYICSDNRIGVGCSGGGLYLNNGYFIGLITFTSDNSELIYSIVCSDILNFVGGIS